MNAEEEDVARTEESGGTCLGLVAADDAEERVVAEVAAEIREMGRQASIAFTCAVGRLLVERFYGGDRTAWRSRSPAKQSSFRRLAVLLAGPDGMKATALYYCVGIFDLVERLGGQAAIGRRLTVTHLRAVLALPEPDQRHFLETADEEGWSSRDLEAAVRCSTACAARRTPPAFVAEIRRIEHVVVDQNLLLKEIARVRELRPSTTDDLAGSVMRIRERFDLMQKALDPKTVRAARSGIRRTDDLS